MQSTTSDEIRDAVRAYYSAIATGGSPGCCSPKGQTGCCVTEEDLVHSQTSSEKLGYTAKQLTEAPVESNLGLGCGNPQAIAELKTGETVLDLGSGAGFDSFLAARQVEPTGRVIGVDMTPTMISKARENAAKGNFANVEFRLGEIEHMPLADNTVDAIISNCVINLSPSKQQVFHEAWRVLKSGGRLAISDIVASAELPEEVRRDLALYTGCMAGASLIGDLEAMLQAAGFVDIRIQPKDASRVFIRDWAPGRSIEDYVVSASIEAVKP